jgi:pimeloyl-ACP methyl ester carboxylesterase
VVTPRPVLIYLPGMDGSGKLFYLQEMRLAPYCDVRSLSIPLEDLGDWQSLAQRVYALVPEDRPAILLGESFGGCLALWCAMQRPHLYSHLVLVNPASSWRRLNWLVQTSRGLNFFPSTILLSLSAIFLPFLCAVQRIQSKDRSALLNAMTQVPKSTILHRLNLLENFQLDDGLENLKLPTLLLGSREDRLLPSLDEVRLLAKKLPNAQVETLPESGHAALLEEDINIATYLVKYKFLG